MFIAIGRTWRPPGYTATKWSASKLRRWPPVSPEDAGGRFRAPPEACGGPPSSGLYTPRTHRGRDHEDYTAGRSGPVRIHLRSDRSVADSPRPLGGRDANGHAQHARQDAGDEE